MIAAMAMACLREILRSPACMLFERMTYAAVRGTTMSMTQRSASSLMASASLAPKAEPTRANAAQGRAIFQFTKPCLMKRLVASAVPMHALILLVAIAVWAGNPAMKNAGSDMSPPPPAMASTKPASMVSGHTMRNGMVDSTVLAGLPSVVRSKKPAYATTFESCVEKWPPLYLFESQVVLREKR